MDRDAVLAFFDEPLAERYDAQRNNIEPLHDALDLATRVMFAELPDEPRILCVGAGTGSEIVALAEHLPGASFTAVEPAPAMLERCRQKLEAAGLSERCHLHGGFLDSLPDPEPFDAATCLLVTHFFTDRAERVAFLAGIRARLRPGGLFVNADLSWPTDAHDADDLVMDRWVRFMRLSGAPVDRERYEQNIGQHVGVLRPSETERVLRDSGLSAPTPFYRLLMIGAWVSRA